MHSARHIHETAPLGSLIKFANGEPRPPERFRIKLRDWERENGSGRLVARAPASDRLPATFTLHLGNFGSKGVIIMVMRRQFDTDSAELFEIAELPKPGMVRVLTSHGDREELLHLAADMGSAERWMEANDYSNMRAEIVSDPSAAPCAEAKAA